MSQPFEVFDLWRNFVKMLQVWRGRKGLQNSSILRQPRSSQILPGITSSPLFFLLFHAIVLWSFFFSEFLIFISRLLFKAVRCILPCPPLPSYYYYSLLFIFKTRCLSWFLSFPSLLCSVLTTEEKHWGRGGGGGQVEKQKKEWQVIERKSRDTGEQVIKCFDCRKSVRRVDLITQNEST